MTTSPRLPSNLTALLARRETTTGRDRNLVWSPQFPAGPYSDNGSDDLPDLRPAHELVPPGTWTPEPDLYIVELTRTYGVYTPAVFVTFALPMYPHLAEAAKQSPPITWSLHNRFDADTYVGPVAALVFSRMLALVAWEPRGTLVCPLCQEEFDAESLHMRWDVVAYGPPRWCRDCCRAGSGAKSMSIEEAHEGIRHYVDVVGALPTSEWDRLSIPHDLPDVERDELMAARIAMPHSSAVAAMAPSPWNLLLAEAGVVDRAQRTGRGVPSRAQDGHVCRSMFERAVDDFLYRHQISHEPEPLWPAHETLNPRGLKRADWRLADGTMVEAAGLLADPGYARRMADKQALAAELTIPLLVLKPDDVRRLPLVFGRWLDEPDRPKAARVCAPAERTLGPR